jgi:hypothetical protein
LAFVADFGIINFNLKNKIDMEHKTSTNYESGNDANRLLAVRACEGSCEVHKGEVVPVIIERHGWDGIKFNYCQAAIEEDERRGFVVRHDR